MKGTIKGLAVFGIILLITGGIFLSFYFLLYFSQYPEDAEIEIRCHDGDFEMYDFISGSGTDEDPYVISNLIIETNKMYALSISCGSEVLHIINCTITNNYNKRRIENIGIWLSFHGRALIENNTIRSYGGGIIVDRYSPEDEMSNDTYVTVKNNQIYDVGGHLGIDSPNAEIINNSLIRDTEPKDRWIYGSSIFVENHLTISNNTLINTGFDFHTSTSSSYLDNLDLSTIKIEGNKVNGLPLLAVIDEMNMFLENLNIGQAVIIGSENITLSKFNIQNTSNGISVLLSNNCTIVNNELSSNIIGIRVYNCDLLSIINNTIQNHLNIAIDLIYLDNSIISENTCITSWRGIDLSSSSGNIVVSNTVSECNGGISVFIISFDNIIKDNLIQYNRGSWGFYIAGDNSLIYNNTLIDNNTDRHRKQGYDRGSGNKWYYGTIGNKWSDWSGEGYYYLDGDAGNYDPCPGFP